MGIRTTIIVLVALIFAGCTASAPTVDTTDASKMTFDGLYPVKGTRADEAWARPGADLSQYSKIMLRSVGVEYRPGGESGRTVMSRSRGGPYEVTEEQKAAFQRITAEAAAMKQRMPAKTKARVYSPVASKSAPPTTGPRMPATP